MNRTLKPHLGFSMIEVLITLLLVCIGVLGMVALQGKTIAYTQDSVQRNVAATLANDLIELMRAKPDGLPATSGFYKAKSDAFPSKPAACAPLPDTASGQLACLAERAKAALPGASDLLESEFYVCRSKAPGNCTTSGSAVEIQLAWRVKAGECMDSSDTGDNTICRYRLRSQL